MTGIWAIGGQSWIEIREGLTSTKRPRRAHRPAFPRAGAGTWGQAQGDSDTPWDKPAAACCLHCRLLLFGWAHL